MASPSCMLSRDLTGNTHTSDWLKWPEAEIIRGYCTHVSCIWDGMTQSMGLALTPDLRPYLTSCVFGSSKHGPCERKSPESEQGRSLVICLTCLQKAALSLPLDSMGYSWITKNYSKRRKLDPSLCGEISSLPYRRAWGMENIVAIGFMKNSLS